MRSLGGPLVTKGWGDGVTPGQNFELIGVVSWGYRCAQIEYPGVFARVTEALHWITSISGAGKNCPRQ